MEKIAGKFLVAAPNMKDPAFEKTVIFIAGHSSEHGAIGMVINRSGGISLHEVYQQLGVDAEENNIEEKMIGWGGPVEGSHGYILYAPKGNETVSPVIYNDSKVAVTVSPEVLFSHAKGKGPNHLLIVLGCAAWVPGQLEEELSQQAWLVACADSKVMFELPMDQRYEAALALVGLSERELEQRNTIFSANIFVGHA